MLYFSCDVGHFVFSISTKTSKLVQDYLMNTTTISQSNLITGSEKKIFLNLANHNLAAILNFLSDNFFLAKFPISVNVCLKYRSFSNLKNFLFTITASNKKT